MKKRIARFLSAYFLLVLLFMLQKPFFMLFYHDLYQEVPLTEYFRVMGHGLPLDFSIAGYLSVIPGLLLTASCWVSPHSHFIRRALQGYSLLIALFISCICISDLGLYRYWGFRLDTTPLFYFLSSPKDALASVGGWVIAGGIAAMLFYAILISVLYLYIYSDKSGTWQRPRRRIATSCLLLLLTAFLFLPIRGGVTVATLNTGKVFYSNNPLLNHAAINPCFSLIESMTKQSHFDRQYRFMEAEEADRLFTGMSDRPAPADSIPRLFSIRRPNMIFIVLESFSTHLMKTFGGTPDVAVHLDQLSQESILFTRFYANSFRTDRGLVSIFSGYPAQPTTSIMKYTRKTQHLPSLTKSLQAAGYDLAYYYGGDADFANMRSYLVSAGFEKIISDKDFPISERLSKWGAHDHVVFNRLLADLKRHPRQPFLSVLQTSSSHEPFEVPYRRLENPRLNAFAYTDSCTGAFIEQFRSTEAWKNTIVILVPDHLGAYPENIDNLSPSRYHIPLIITGGAIRKPRHIDVYGSQIDIAATLLAQLELPHTEFKFSKNMLNPDSPHFAYFTFPNAFGIFDRQNTSVFNCDTNRPVTNEGPDKENNMQKGKAFLQKLYDDLEKR